MMTTTPLPSFYAPVERADDRALRAQHEKLSRLELVSLLLNSFPEGAVILNAQRQIVFANDKVASFLSVPQDSLIGLRLGEALGCNHAYDLPAGCGTTESCRFCGAAQAMEASRLNRTKEVEECRISRSAGLANAAFELKVWATPLMLEGEQFTILAVRDISDEKRRQFLERIFFHDVMNLAGGLRGVLELLPDLSGAEAVEFEHMAGFQADQLVEEIESQRDLTAAERGDLAVHSKPVIVRELLDRLCFLYRHHPVATGKTLMVEAIVGGAALNVDPVLLRRVIGNLVKNALEASQPGETVAVRYTSDLRGHVFAVHNPAVLSDAVRAQIFQRSFSSKPGKGRGLGSYSVKLLSERYLSGRVEFDSARGRGTTFRVVLPASPSEAPAAGLGSAHVVRAAGNDVELVGRHVLLAEDNVVNQHLVNGLLRKCGVQVHVVSNGKEAVAAVRTQRFDALLMDAEMPEMDGFEAAAAIRAFEHEAAHVPIIALTAHTSEKDRLRCLAAGMDEYLTKPVTNQALVAALARQIRAKAAPSEIPLETANFA